MFPLNYNQAEVPEFIPGCACPHCGPKSAAGPHLVVFMRPRIAVVRDVFIGKHFVPWLKPTSLAGANELLKILGRPDMGIVVCRWLVWHKEALDIDEQRGN